jgi:hypothetical protein
MDDQVVKRWRKNVGKGKRSGSRAIMNVHMPVSIPNFGNSKIGLRVLPFATGYSIVPKWVIAMVIVKSIMVLNFI